MLLTEILDEVPDPRGYNAVHDLTDVLFVALAAVLCGAVHCTEMAFFARTRLELLRKFVPLERGAPSHDTFTRVLGALDPEAFQAAFSRFMAAFGAQARIDTHENWLEDVMRFTGALQFAALLLTLIIGVTTLVAVAGGVRSKLSENKDELELLHLMGASDSYIARQLQRHTLILSLQGGAAGVLAGGILLFIISVVAGKIGVNLVPDFRLDDAQKLMLLLLPVPIAVLAMITARFTVLRVLAKMP